MIIKRKRLGQILSLVLLVVSLLFIANIFCAVPTTAASLSWTVSLSVSTTKAAANQSVTLTATTNHNVGSTPWGLYIIDTTNGNQQNFPSGTNGSWTLAYNGTTHNFVARVGMFNGSQTQASSNNVSVTWASNTLSVATKLSDAVAWAKTQIGSRNWGTGTNTYCELFVENAFGTSGRFSTAYAGYQSIGISGSPQIPGQIVFFSKNSSNGGYGHVGIYIGNGQFISVTSSGVQLESLSWWSSNVASYVGYASPPSSWPGR
jgi:cell wall-associated NlpC family hydrolase